MPLEVTVNREPYLGNLHEVRLYLPDGAVRGVLLKPEAILGLLRQVRKTGACFVHFTGRRATRTFGQGIQEG